MLRRSVFALSLFSTIGFGLLQAQATRPLTQPRPAAKAPLMTAVDPALLNGMRYRLVGPSRGGRVTTVTGVPSQPRTFYMGVASGGVFRTTDGGASWVPITVGSPGTELEFAL